MKIILLTNLGWADQLCKITAASNIDSTAIFTKNDLIQFFKTIDQQDAAFTLVSFATGVIVPEKIINSLAGNAYNIHPATPEYPGRDPHHFAHFDQIKTYGATAHIMTSKVDAGQIVDVETYKVPAGSTPQDYINMAEKSGVVLFGSLVGKLASGEPVLPTGQQWGTRKTTRLDFKSFCRISPLDGSSAIGSRLASVAAPGHNNAYLDLSGHRFGYEGPTPVTDVHSRDQKRWADFTENKYRHMLFQAKKDYKFASYLEGRTGRHLILRHDLDHSIHQAYRIAEIEHNLGIKASYMFTLRLPYYNILEHDTQKIAREILKMGHSAGLHFDAAAYEKDQWSEAELEDTMAKERDLLSQSLDAPIEAVSYHDPTCGNFIAFDKDIMAGMVNCYGKTLRDEYGYCSDSNGYWRHKPIPEVIASVEHEQLHVLVHPEWWTPTAMPPRQRIERAVLLEAQNIMKTYDDHLARSGRDNIR
ncbi:MAG: hypothetical protein JKY25_08480 [Robiginitomaculum sp.]|nr:hypothetical protein [Robiginitomaculum sp.]